LAGYRSENNFVGPAILIVGTLKIMNNAAKCWYSSN